MADAALAWTLPALLLVAGGGACAVALLPRAAARAVTLAAMLAILALALAAAAGRDAAGALLPLAFDLPLLPAAGLRLQLGVDGLNVLLLLLTALLFPVVLGCLWRAPEAQRRLYPALLLALEACLLGCFLAQDLVVFFVFWEAVLIPMLLLIAVFGGPQRRRAARVFFFYTMAGSVLLLAAVILLGAAHRAEYGVWSFDLAALQTVHLAPGAQAFVFVAVALACAIKCPLLPFHAWLPLAYREAPGAGTALMAGLLSKMGAYGFLRLALPLCPDVAPLAAPALVLLAVASILYGALLALRQSDPRLLVAYASLSHMGFIVLGVFSFTPTALQGALLQVAAHGLGVAGLFLLLTLLAQRAADAQAPLGALARQAPRLAVLTMLFVLAALALPLSGGFTAEFLILLGAFREGWAAWQAGAGALRLVAAVAATGAVVLAATYMLRLARASIFGHGEGGAGADPGHRPPVRDLGLREGAALVPLVALLLWFGLWPAPWMALTQPALAPLANFSLSGAARPAAVPSVLPAAAGSAHGR